jgi:hypothetical protein
VPEGELFAAFEDTDQKIENFGVIPVEIFPELDGYNDQERKSSDQIRYINTKYVASDGSRTNFGFWDEYTITYTTQLTGDLLGIFVNYRSIGITNDTQTIINPAGSFELTAIGQTSVGVQYDIQPNSDAAIIGIPGVLSNTTIPHTSFSGPGFSATRSGLFMFVTIRGLSPNTPYTLQARYVNEYTQTAIVGLPFTTASYFDSIS